MAGTGNLNWLKYWFNYLSKKIGFLKWFIFTEVLALKSPAGGVGVHVLSTILKLTKTFIEMFKARHNPALSKVFDMLHMEKNGINGQSSVNDNDR